MDEKRLSSYSKLLLDYCLRVNKGDKLYIHTTTLALPLVQTIYKEVLERQAIPEVSMLFEHQEELYNQYAHESFIRYINPAYQQAMEEFDAYLFIRAPFETTSQLSMPPTLRALQREVLAPIHKLYAQRTGNGTLRRTLCQFPTIAAANEADMTVAQFDSFISTACFLDEAQPELSWALLGQNQQHYVNYLCSVKSLTYINAKSHITCSVEGRNWINSDGKNNMPSGEIYTSPVEDSVNGYIYFDFPFLYQHHHIEGVHLKVENGVVITGEAEIGNEFFQEILNIPGARQFGEIAIGMNSNIKKPIKNILFDEKIAGTVHMALGQSYLQCGGKNESAVHLDLIADMRTSGQILADNKLIYDRGVFLI